MWDLVGEFKDRFSHRKALISLQVMVNVYQEKLEVYASVITKALETPARQHVRMATVPMARHVHVIYPV